VCDSLLHALEQVDSGKTTHFAVAVGKCNQGDYSWEGATNCPPGCSILDIASGRVLLEISSAVAPSNIEYLNGMLNFEVINMRSTCIKTTSECGKYTHCNAGTSEEGIQRADLLHDSADYCNGLGVPIIVFGVGGDGCGELWNKLQYNKFTKVCEHSGHMYTADSFCSTYLTDSNQMIQVTQKYSVTSDALRVFDMDVVHPRALQFGLHPTRPDPLIDIMRTSDSTRYIGNPNVKAELKKAEESHQESRSKGGCHNRDNIYAKLEEQALGGEGGIHKIKCTQPINRPIELPDGYTRKDFLTGDETWECPYPDCMVINGAGKGKPRIFDSSSKPGTRKSHVSLCKDKYEKANGASAECEFERLGRPNNGEYFHLTCPRCQEAGGHRPSTAHGSWLDLGETTEVGLPCNENEDNEADSSDGSDTDSVSENEPVVEEDWKLTHIFSEKELRKTKRTKCDNCHNAACSIWENTESGEKWTCCIDCQVA